ncbi:MAG: hypothetical protein P0107_05295 [Nitrosomonas sp.]|nr:hypothetical protein [Nitrosomonas sp.]
MITFRTPLGSSIDHTDSRLKLIEGVLASYPSEVASYLGNDSGAGEEAGNEDSSMSACMTATIAPRTQKNADS